MKKPSHLVAAFTLAATLVLSSCSTGTDATTVAADGTSSVVNASSVTAAVAELTYENLGIDEADLSIELAEAVEVTLADGASAGGSGVSVDGDTVTVDAAGTYRVSGTLTSGSLVVDAPDAVVNLVLDGVDVTAADVAAINVVEADQVVVWLADGAVNKLADAEGSTMDDTVEDSPNATLFSSADLWIAGDGALAVTAHAADAITSKDTLVVTGGDLTVEAADDGVRGKDHLVITGGTLVADVDGDALRSDNESVTDDPDAAVGVIWIDGGTLDLTAGSDAIDAARQVTILSGDLAVAAGDDGIHSDNVLRLAGGDVSITESVEGIEGAYLYLSGGDVSVVASDDGINVSGGVEGLADETVATTSEPGTEPGAELGTEPGTELGTDPGAMAGARPEGGPPSGGEPMGDRPVGEPGMGERPAGGQMPGGGLESDVSAEPVDDLDSLTVAPMEGSGFGGRAEGDNGTRLLEISGGTYVIDTTSDGVDVNGTMTMTGGTLVVSGTEDVRQGALDVDDVFTLTGGTLAANGMATMAVAPGESSTQAALALTFGGVLPAGTLITITDSFGDQVSSFTTPKASESYIYSSDALESGADYEISVGGEVSGTSIGWLVLDGTASDGTVIGTVAAS